MDASNSVLVIAGPTACGKTETAIAAAEALSGEVVCGDSMQIYNTLSVGTARPTAQETARVPHHLFGFLDPAERYNLARYCDDAVNAIADIHARGRLPILCGGTGLYLSAVTDGLELADEDESDVRRTLRHRLQTEGAEALLAQLRELDPAAALRVHPNNEKRLVRYLELVLTTGKPLPEREAVSRQRGPKYRTMLAVLWPEDRAWLHRRIGRRVDNMLKAGLVREARLVYDNRECWMTAGQAIGYKEFFPYFEGTKPLDECVESLKTATRRYAKRQMSWFRRWHNARFYPITDDREAADCCRMIIQDYAKTERITT